MAFKATGVALAALLLAAAAPAAGQQQQPRRRIVTVEASGIFGDELLMPERYNTVLVRVTNHTRRPFRGHVDARVQHWNAPSVRHQVPLDLPPHASRQVRVTLFIGELGTGIACSYVAEEGLLAEAVISPGYAGARDGIVVMSDPPRLRGALLDLPIETQDPAAMYGGGGPRSVNLPVGVVSLDATTGDPIVPEHAVGWAPARVVVASAPMLERIPEADRAALSDWIAGGGRLLVFLRTESDAAAPFLRSLIGESRFVAESVGPESFVPSGAAVRRLEGGRRLHTESFGASAPHGHGHVYVATYDGTAPPFVESEATRELVRAVAAEVTPSEERSLLFPFGAGNETAEGYGWAPMDMGFNALRASLDPNESFRPALGLVAIILLLYVFLVGPANFAFIAKRGKPTLALLTTPAAAASCLVVLLGVGYIGKGTRMRYRSVEMTEAIEGEPVAPSRRYLGLFLTRPADFEVTSPPRGMTRTVRTASGDRVPVVDHGADQPVLRELRGRLWETVFLREERVVELGNGIGFEREWSQLTAVVNRSTVALSHAVVIDGLGAVYDVGRVPAGASAPIPAAATMTVGTQPMFYGEDDPKAAALGRLLGIGEDEREAFVGLAGTVGGTLLSMEGPVLLGRVEAPADHEEAGLFGREIDLRLVRVLPYRPRPLRLQATLGDPDGEEGGPTFLGDDEEAGGGGDGGGLPGGTPP